MSSPNVTISDAPQILNPNTPLAYLTPEQAYQSSVAIYVLAGSLGVSNPLILYERIVLNVTLL